MTAHREVAYAARSESVALPISAAASDSSIILMLHGALSISEQDEVVAALIAAADGSRNASPPVGYRGLARKTPSPRVGRGSTRRPLTSSTTMSRCTVAASS
jgi:hypothetical protein